MSRAGKLTPALFFRASAKDSVMSTDLARNDRQRSHRRRSLLIVSVAVLLLLLIFTGGYLGLKGARASTPQPLAYSHRAHVQNGIQCLYCHTEATRSQKAGIPSVEKCMGCHSVIATKSEGVQELAGYWERGETIPWKRINDQPDFVYFSHQPHISAGMNCETCHGNVGDMDLAEATIRMDMGWCLDCHKNQAPEQVARLLDCLACHK